MLACLFIYILERKRERGGGGRETERGKWRGQDGERVRERDRERQRQRQTDRQTDRQTENANSKTLFYKECSLGSIKTCLKL